MESFKLKLECVGHVEKCLGSRLRYWKKRLGATHLEDGKGISRKGRLTKQTDKLQGYYGIAIRQHSYDLSCMQTAAMAIWHHTRSTGDNPDYDLCPPDENSRCGYQGDIANAKSDYVHQNSLPEAVAEEILPTFEALSDGSLLSKRLHGVTQNQNEALNGMIWQRATKETHSSLLTVELATFLAVSVFNDGASPHVCPGCPWYHPWQSLQKSLCKIGPQPNSTLL